MDGNNRISIAGNKTYVDSVNTFAEVQKTCIYSFMAFIILISIINIVNTISTSILVRAKELAGLKSIGMSNKQKMKMMILEGLFYGMDSLFIGIAISMGIIWSMYLLMVNTQLNKFIVPYKEIFMCIIGVYVAIFGTILWAKRKSDKGNIIDELKNENI